MGVDKVDTTRGQRAIYSKTLEGTETSSKEALYLLGLMNTSIVAVIMSVLSPTIDYHEGPIGKIPVIFDDIYDEFTIED